MEVLFKSRKISTLFKFSYVKLVNPNDMLLLINIIGHPHSPIYKTTVSLQKPGQKNWGPMKTLHFNWFLLIKTTLGEL